jgi:hypothetical protein
MLPFAVRFFVEHGYPMDKGIAFQAQADVQVKGEDG